MFCDYNPGLESRNYIDGLIFTRHDPCIWVVYPGGAAGDLLISIIDRHYLRTGCEYYGINDRGRVMLYTSDYEMIDLSLKHHGCVDFNNQWFYDFSDQLGARNLTYSMLDQVIFGCHMHRVQDIHQILENFSQARIINIHARDSVGCDLIENMKNFKLQSKNSTKQTSTYQETDHQISTVSHERVLNIPFGFLFNRSSYHRYYAEIRQFLNLQGPLICFDYIEYYLSKQDNLIATRLKEYSQNL